MAKKTKESKFVRINPFRYQEDVNDVLDVIAGILSDSVSQFKNSNKITNASYEIKPSLEYDGGVPQFIKIEGLAETHNFTIEHIFPTSQNQNEVEAIYVSLEDKDEKGESIEFSCPWNQTRFKRNIIGDVNDFIRTVYKYDENSRTYKMRAKYAKKTFWEKAADWANNTKSRKASGGKTR